MAGSTTETEKKRAAAIQKIESDRRKRVEEVKAVKVAKSAERALAKEAQEAEAQREAARKAELEALNEKRLANIAKKEAARKARADALKERKLNKTKKSKHAERDILLLRQIFDDYDKDGSGAVSVAEFMDALQGTHLADSSDAMVSELNKHRDDRFDFPELLKNLYPYANAQDMATMLDWAPPKPKPQAPQAPPKREISAAQLLEINALFKLYDEDASSGISVRELKSAMQRTFLDEGEIDSLFKAADADDDAQLSLAEFQRLLGSTGLWDGPGVKADDDE